MVVSKNKSLIAILVFAAVVAQVGCGGSSSKREHMSRTNAQGQSPEEKKATDLLLTQIQTLTASLNSADNKTSFADLGLAAGDLALTNISMAYYDVSNTETVRAYQENLTLTNDNAALVENSAAKVATTSTTAVDAGGSVQIPLTFSLTDKGVDLSAAKLTALSQKIDIAGKKIEKSVDTTKTTSDSIANVVAGTADANERLSVKYIKLSDSSIRIYAELTESRSDDQANAKDAKAATKADIVRIYALDYSVKAAQAPADQTQTQTQTQTGDSTTTTDTTSANNQQNATSTDAK